MIKMSKELKHLKKYFKEIKKEQVMRFETGRVYIIYNPLTDNVKEEVASKTDIVHNKHCYDKLRYFIKE